MDSRRITAILLISVGSPSSVGSSCCLAIGTAYWMYGRSMTSSARTLHGRLLHIWSLQKCIVVPAVDWYRLQVMFTAEVGREARAAGAVAVDEYSLEAGKCSAAGIALVCAK